MQWGHDRALHCLRRSPNRMQAARTARPWSTPFTAAGAAATGRSPHLWRSRKRIPFIAGIHRRNRTQAALAAKLGADLFIAAHRNRDQMGDRICGETAAGSSSLHQSQPRTDASRVHGEVGQTPSLLKAQSRPDAGCTNGEATVDPLHCIRRSRERMQAACAEKPRPKTSCRRRKHKTRREPGSNSKWCG